MAALAQGRRDDRGRIRRARRVPESRHRLLPHAAPRRDRRCRRAGSPHRAAPRSQVSRALRPVERGILLLRRYELMRELEVPYRVVINEAVELAKSYGGTDGHKYRERRARQARSGIARARSLGRPRWFPRAEGGRIVNHPTLAEHPQAHALVLFRRRRESLHGLIRACPRAPARRCPASDDDGLVFLVFAAVDFYFADENCASRRNALHAAPASHATRDRARRMRCATHAECSSDADEHSRRPESSRWPKLSEFELIRRYFTHPAPQCCARRRRRCRARRVARGRSSPYRRTCWSQDAFLRGLPIRAGSATRRSR